MTLPHPATPAIELRIATLADAEALCAAERETSRTPGQLLSRPYEFLETNFHDKIAQLASTGLYAVAEVDGKPVGHALLEPMAPASLAHVFSLTIVVHPGHSGRGIGSALMAYLMDWAERNENVEKLELRVRASNLRARALYQRFGFVEEGRFEKRVKLPDGSYLADISMARFPRPSQTTSF